MSGSSDVLADFTGSFTVEGTWDQKPANGRVLLNADQLVFVGPETKEAFRLSWLVDISLGRVPSEYNQYFSDSVTVAFESEGGPSRSATIEADGEAIGQFGRLLFKIQLHETTVSLNHPAQLGGRVVDGGFGSATLYLRDDGVAFGDIETPFRVPLDSVVGFGRPERTVRGTTRPVLSVRHVRGGDCITTEIDVESGRLRNLLGRYLRIEYGKRRGEIQDIDLSTAEKQALVAVHSGASVNNFPETLDADPGQVSTLLTRLENEGLLTMAEEGVRLTATGQVASEEHLDDVDT